MENPPLLEWLDRFCEEKGCVQEVGEEFYQVFLTATAGELTALIRALLHESALWASRPNNASLRTETRLCENAEALLDLFAMGRAIILDNGRLGLTKPVGPPPVPETGRAIAARLRAVLLLPDNLFYNTTAAGIIVVLNRAKRPGRLGKVILINAAAEFAKGRPKNYLTEAGIERIAAAFHAGVDADRFVKAVTNEEVAANDYNLSPSRYVATGAAVEHRPIQTILDELAGIDEEARRLDDALAVVFRRLGFALPAKPATLPSDGEKE